MKRFTALLVAAIVGLCVVPSTASARGHRPIRGDVDVQFNMGVIFGVGVAADPETNVSYIGDITFGKQDYTLVWFNVLPPEPECTVCYVEETWSIYESAEYEFGVVDVPGVGEVPGVLTSFEPGALVFEGSDKAIGGPGGYFAGWGPITDVGPAADGRFEHLTGGRVFWFGSYDTPEVGPGTRFAGDFIVFPRYAR